ncbi:MAG: tetratricopeptide repeat protein [Terricaulis sp.]
MTNDSETLFQEVEERVRQDRFVAMAKRWGPWVLGAFVAMLLGIGGWQAWKSVQENAAREQADAFATAQVQARSGEADAAKAAFEAMSTEGPQAYRVMAMMEHAACSRPKAICKPRSRASTPPLKRRAIP